MLAAAGGIFVPAASSVLIRQGVKIRESSEVNKRLQWEKANRYGKLFRNRRFPVVTEVLLNDEFWRLWKEDKAAMMADGYFVRKLEDGWHGYWKTEIPQ